ncbi:MAG: phosphoribosyltransferase [Deltaproteobacteria bacterium]|nr:MAG: phosphoribosyltransferase [Deltaproteobacteria bacterium]
MRTSLPTNVVALSDLRDQLGVFRNREHAGEILARMLEDYSDSEAIVMAVPAGGVPVAKVLAEHLNLPLDIAVVSKITLPWNTEVGYGAVAFDGTVRLNNDLVARLGLADEEIQQGISKTSAKVAHRVKNLRGGQTLPDLSTSQIILVDDGLASGFTMQVAVEAVQKAGTHSINVAVPTGHQRSVGRIAGEVDILYCANIRGGYQFAVADAYLRWSDVSEKEVVSLLAGALR